MDLTASCPSFQDPPRGPTCYSGAQLGWGEEMTADGHRQGMPTQPLVALGQMIGELAAVQKEQAEANRQFLGALQAQVERQARALEQLAAQPAAAPLTQGPAAFAGLTLQRMTGDDDVQSFLETFEAEACGWPAGEWPVRLLPLLTGEAQIAAMGLPPDWGCCRKTTGGDSAFGQRLRDAATRWLQPDGAGGVQGVLTRVVLEQFGEGLPARTAAWVQCHRPTTLEAAITLAEDHLAVHPNGHVTGRIRQCWPDQELRRDPGRLRGWCRFPLPTTHRPRGTRAPFPTHREVLKRRGRSVGGAGGSVTSGESAR
ncbi:uncharacterized protein LOC144388950 [Gasterosteus aculeatus]